MLLINYWTLYWKHGSLVIIINLIFIQVKLPDVEFFINLGDWPLEQRKQGENPLPIFSWCGSDDTSDIVMPTYDIMDSTLETLRG